MSTQPISPAVEHDKADLTVHHDVAEADLKATQKAENFLADAQAGNDSETKMGLIAALKLYPKASASSIAISFAVVMEGFDIILISNFYAYPAFRNRFGVEQANGTYQIPAPWQAGLGNGAAVGQFIGLILNGIIAEKFGYRRVMICALAYMSCIFFLHFFAKSLPMLLAAQILIGIPWGIFQTLTTSYASEVSPVALRAYLTTWVNACWGIGQLLALAVLRALLSREDDWGWRIPYALQASPPRPASSATHYSADVTLQWIWPVPLAVIAFFAPESPWWLVRKERYEDAKRSLARLTYKKGREDFDADQTIAMMRHTIESEKEATAGATYLDCFRGTNLRRTEIVMGCWAVQQLCGSAFMNYSTYFFASHNLLIQQAGLEVRSSFDLSMGQYAINTGGTFIAWFLMGSGIGRRTLYLYGTCFMFVFLLIIGGVSTIPGTQASWAAAVMLLCWSIAYQFSVGSVCYSIVSEISARRLLIKSVNLGRALYCLLGIVKGTITPYMLNPTAWNWKGKTAFFWAGFNALCIVWIYFRLPEPTGLSYAELDVLFESKVPARNFKKETVNAFSRDRARIEEVREVLAKDEQRVERGA